MRIFFLFFRKSFHNRRLHLLHISTHMLRRLPAIFFNQPDNGRADDDAVRPNPEVPIAQALHLLGRKIELVTKIKVPETLPFEDSDLCRIIVNLLDNAMEAVVRAKNKAFLVDLKIMKQHNYLYIGVQNELRDEGGFRQPRLRPQDHQADRKKIQRLRKLYHREQSVHCASHARLFRSRNYQTGVKR